MDTPETANGQRERAPVEGVVDSDIPTQSLGKKRRVGDLHLALVAAWEVVKEHAKWWHFEMGEKIDAQSKKDPGAPSGVDGGGPVLSAWIAEERNRVSEQELTGVGESAHGGLVTKAKEGELAAWRQFKVSSPVQMGAHAKDAVDTP